MSKKISEEKIIIFDMNNERETKIKIKTNLSINNLIAANNTTCTFHVFDVRAVVSIEQKRSPYLSADGKNGTK